MWRCSNFVEWTLVWQGADTAHYERLKADADRRRAGDTGICEAGIAEDLFQNRSKFRLQQGRVWIDQPKIAIASNFSEGKTACFFRCTAEARCL
jgi:hypothetical protein